jgi:two-component system alkaline phosphatase synthesis response regulator PhoP
VTRDATARVLVVEDEEALAEGLSFNLQRKHYHVEMARDGREAIALATTKVYDLILLDVRLPEVDGFEVCRQIRHAGNFTPILMLTARNQPDDIVYGLKLGADDYVTKPFDLAELLARIEGMLRRRNWWRQELSEGDNEPPEQTSRNGAAGRTDDTEANRFVFGQYWVDFRTWHAHTRQGLVELSRKEVSAMKLFCSRPNQVISRRELLAEVWELPNHPNERVVDNVIVSLRRAFEEDAWRPRHILNVRGVGYRFVP